MTRVALFCSTSSLLCFSLAVFSLAVALQAQEPPKIQAIKPKEVSQKTGKLTMKDVPLIPRKAFFGNPEKARPRLSHDGMGVWHAVMVDDSPIRIGRTYLPAARALVGR